MTQANLIVAILIVVLGWEVACKDTKPTCDFKEKRVKFFDVKISATQVPANLTTYVCQTIKIPINLDRDYHAIGFLPLIKNPKVVHHMILFGCQTRYDTMGIHRCGSSDNRCRQFLVQWSRGLDGAICNHQDAGVKFGFGSIKSFILQIHWNNQFNEKGLQDASGFRVFYTPKLRKHDIGNVQIGQNDLEIPPGQTQFPQSGSCSSECTDAWLPHPIYLTRAHIHMHYTGDGGSMHILRDGSEVMEVLNDASYDYDSPPAHSFPKPIMVRPGDEIRVTCKFNTKDGQRWRNRTLLWGEGSDGEMCYAFVTYYPLIKDFNQCIQFDQYDICPKDGFAALGECIFPGFIHVFKGMAEEILQQCTSHRAELYFPPGEEELCSSHCQAALYEVTSHPCMQGRLRTEAERNYLPEVSIWPQIRTVIRESERICNANNHGNQ